MKHFMQSIRRVLVVQPYGIGDLLFVTPVLRALRLHPTVEKVDLLLGSRTEAVVEKNPHVDEIFSVDKDLFRRQGNLHTFQDILALGKKLRKNRYDLLIDYSLRAEYAFFGQFFLGIGRRVGFNYKRRGFFHNRRLSIPQGFCGRHVADYFCDLAEKSGIKVEDRFLEFYLTQADRLAAKQFLQEKFQNKKYIAVSVGGGESWGKDAHFKR
ncbi:MAG: glycosyltransferase family 9 protein, partial [Candidatus Omnitrophica bacterium]|nr:glycosyltransferase family 9 protein [Candidatus Omnitrophota bacterium]